MSFERTTPCGVISGTACQWPGIAAYKGIRYATAGRWEFPIPVTHWDGVYDATQYGACCYQPRAFYDEAAAPGKAFYYNEFRKGETYTYSEDCLFLNIWTPADAAPGDRLPVIFYIHGGGFTGGCGHEKHFDGPVWPTKGCVAVTINYRLGPMGFVCLPALADEAGSTGNYAFLDQLAALQWVRANIAAFGGDANNITIMGQSAGAMSVQQLVLSPITRGLFSKAVMSSGGGVSQMLTAKPAEAHYPFWKQVMETAGCSTLAHCWRPFTEKDTALSAQMVDYLTNFARTGDPNGADLPQWQTVTAQQTDFLRLGEEPTHMGSVDVQKLLWTMQNVPAVGE